MKNIKKSEYRYNLRVNKVLRKDYKMGVLPTGKSIGAYAVMCKEMLGCMLDYFPKIHYVYVQESDDDTGVWFQEFSSDTEEYTIEEKEEQFMSYSDGWHVVNINHDKVETFKKRIFEIVNDDSLYNETILEKYRDQKRELGNVLFQYGLMHIFYHEYGHAMDGHVLAKKHGKIAGTNQESRALEYNADIFAVNQIIKRFLYDNHSEVYTSATQMNFTLVLDEIALMMLGCYIFLDGFYDRNDTDYVTTLLKDETHMPPFLRQFCNFDLFSSILTKHLDLDEADMGYMTNVILHHIDEYEKSCHNSDVMSAPFWLGIHHPIAKLKQSEAQKCWNSIYDILLEYISPFVEITKYDVLNVATGKYEKWNETQ